MSLISEKTIKEIQEQKITPRPRWQFLLKNYMVEAFFALTVFFGALAVTAIIFMLFDHDWDVFEYLDRSLLEHIFASLPYFWLVVLAMFAAVAYYNFRQTRQGYQYETYKIFLINIALSVVIGSAFYVGGLGKEIHEFFASRIPFYENFVYNKKDIWIFPEKGLLSGEIIEVLGEGDYNLKDCCGKIWRIHDGKLEWHGYPEIQPGLKVKLIGRQIGCCTFEAEAIRLWERH